LLFHARGLLFVWSAGPSAARPGGMGIASELCYNPATVLQQIPAEKRPVHERAPGRQLRGVTLCVPTTSDNCSDSNQPLLMGGTALAWGGYYGKNVRGARKKYYWLLTSGPDPLYSRCFEESEQIQPDGG
jgi:hypothetical protein